MKKEYKNPSLSILGVKTQPLMGNSGNPTFVPDQSTGETSGNLAPRHNYLYGDENTRVQD